ncbi:hypothetical protein Pint_12685 [Pistacia integerrima]|uniref:Uncharacterized protein n=1 Tax=Pistacia integerrima TaxID=434235 RepID=A0ACC0YB27_9ROSI|nr:hypothetical protein Pint_12685 [Pistacia integerrima]
MDSPEPTAKTTTAASASASAATLATPSSASPVQESPFSNFLSNLSPIGPVKAPHVLQGFLGLNSPPLVFTSPRINALRETSFFKRSLCPQLPSVEVPQHDDGARKSADGPGDLEKSDLLLHGGLTAITHKDSDIKYSVQVQPSSPAGCVDEYLADHVEVDGANSTSVAQNSKQSSNVVQLSQSGISDSKKTILKFDDQTYMKMKVVVPEAMPGETEQNIQGKTTFDCEPNKIKDEKTCGEWTSNEGSNIESNLSLDHASSKQQYEGSNAQNDASAHGDESNWPPQLLPGQLQIVQTYEHSEENAGAIPRALVDSTTNDPEASQNQRGMSRRCLQFEEAQPKAIVKSTNPSDQANDVTDSRSPATPTESESLDSSYLDLSATFSKRQLVNLPQPVTPLFPPRHTGKSPLTNSKPSGIGLHLNSIVNALPKGHAATVGVKLTTAEYGMLETKTSIAVSSMTSESFDNMPLHILPPIEHHATPHAKRKYNSEHTDSFEEFNQTSPKKKRQVCMKKPLGTIDGEGCKRCNCKKTKCLKLYCDCFAAGIYCAEPCACQGCFNRPEYEDTVLETRQQIESRNPLAFAPKIVQHATEFPDDGNRMTPASARHKRGCNCKKSMCLKKYCECYQANVGCSSGCRCEGCKNVYGRKEDYVENEEMVSNRLSKDRSEGTFEDRLETITNKNDFLHSELYDSRNLTPLTPSFDCSDHGKDAPKSRILFGRCIPSPESDLTILSSYTRTLRSLEKSDFNDMLLETSKEVLDVGACGQRMDYNSTDMTDQFSSRCDTLADFRNLTPLDFPSTAMAPSTSCKVSDWTNASRLQLCPKSGSLSSGSSLRWRSSPITPLTQSDGTKNHQELDSDNRLCDILEADTPDILKDASTPIKSVKVSSPSRKRVSPPHTRGHELRSSSSGALKSGRKFILKAVPSFPPLTPCIDSKGSTNQNKSDFQEKK